MNKKLINWWIGSSQTDSDAEAFFTAAGITDATQKSAVTTLTLGLKQNSLWTKFYAIYPVVGGTATTHKYNLKDPRDLDAAFRLTFSGTVTHSSTGMLPNGTTGYANTFFAPNTYFTSSSGCLGFYSRTDDMSTAQNDMGHSGPGYDRVTTLICKYSDGKSYGGIGNGVLGCNVAVANSLGFYCVSRVSGTTTELFKNGASIKSNVETAVPYPDTLTLFLMAHALNSVASNFSKKQCAFAFMAQTLSASEISTLNTLVQAYQTTLGRNV